MHKYFCTHTLPAGAFTLDQLCQVAEASQHDPNVKGYRSFFNLTEGKAWCVLEAPDQEALAGWFQNMNIPYDSIVPVEYEGECGKIEDVRQQPAMAGA